LLEVKCEEVTMGRAKERKRWTEVEAQAVLREWKESGSTLTAFARQRGYVPERLRRWEKKLDGEPTSRAGFVPVEIVGSTAALRSEASTGERRVEITVSGGLRVVVPDPIDPVLVARLVVELRAAGC
jgi:transposase-like protein